MFYNFQIVIFKINNILTRNVLLTPDLKDIKKEKNY